MFKLVQLATFICLVELSWGLSYHTQLRLVNNLKVAVDNIVVGGVDPYDWDGTNNRPDVKLKDVKIPAQSTYETRLEVNALASNCPYILDLLFADGTEDQFKVNQKFAIGKAPLGLEIWKKSNNHLISFALDGSYTLVIYINSAQASDELTSVEEN